MRVQLFGRGGAVQETAPVVTFEACRDALVGDSAQLGQRYVVAQARRLNDVVEVVRRCRVVATGGAIMLGLVIAPGIVSA